MKKFDLTAAINGSPVVTRDGREVTQIRRMDAVSDGYSVIGGWKNKYLYRIRQVSFSYDSPTDIFMAPTRKTIFVNIYYSPSFHYSKHDSEQEAINTTRSTPGHVYKKLNNLPIPLVIEEQSGE